MWPSVCQPSNTSTTTPTSTTPIRHQRASYGSVPLNITPHSLLPPPPSSLTLKFAFSSGLVTRMTGERSDPAAWNLAGGGGWRRVAAGGGGWRRLGDRRHQIHRFRDAICTSFAADVVDLLCPARGRIIFFLSAPTDVDWTRETDQVGEVANTFHPSKSQTILPLSLPLFLSLLRRPGTIISTHRFVVNISKRREQHQQQQQHFHSIPESSGAKFHGGASQCRFIPGSMDGSIFLARGKTIKT